MQPDPPNAITNAHDKKRGYSLVLHIACCGPLPNAYLNLIGFPLLKYDLVLNKTVFK